MPDDTHRIELEVRQLLTVSAERAFAAWTDPRELQQWWGPQGVRCIGVEIDLRVGGRYRIGNELPDRNVVWIEGVYEVIDRPRSLTFTWSTNAGSPDIERVTVLFNAMSDGTEVIVRHVRIPDQETRLQHEHGWKGCLTGLSECLSAN